MREEVIIPRFYLMLTEGYTNRKSLFVSYVRGYVRNNFQLELKEIKGMTAICERRE